jgi:hypothetical protein
MLDHTSVPAATKVSTVLTCSTDTKQRMIDHQLKDLQSSEGIELLPLVLLV